MYIPGQERYTDITPEEFEVFCLRFLQQEADKLLDSRFEHDVIMKTDDGDYQIDGKISFSYMGVDILCLVECKRFSGPVKREHVALLYSKIQSLGAHKGILMTTSYFQSGALQYAQKHGIALITITDEGMTYHCRDQNTPDRHVPVNGSMFVPILTEAISETSYRDYFLVEKENSHIKEFLQR